jgi:hypothetical protein
VIRALVRAYGVALGLVALYAAGHVVAHTQLCGRENFAVPTAGEAIYACTEDHCLWGAMCHHDRICHCAAEAPRQASCTRAEDECHLRCADHL